MGKMKTFLITGGAGFIGANLIDRVLKENNRVICIDNFLLGKQENIIPFLTDVNFHFIEKDITIIENLFDSIKDYEIDYVFHLAANSDIQLSGQDPLADYKSTFLTTLSVLECMRRKGIKKMFFSSSGAVYGEKPNSTLTENSNLAPISYYGGSKMASEAFISSYAHMNDLDVTIFRFPNVIGPHLTHGVIFDFIKKLKQNPKSLEVLGDGTQNKSYIFVQDLIEAILMIALSGDKGVNIYNIGGDGSTTVREIADMVCAKLGLKDVSYIYSGGDRGWKGDIPTFQFDVSKIHQRGWYAKHNSTEAVQATLDAIL
ncbi:UDP-glucose 4-epimerase [Spirochaetia bacterium]|nr:UDP-glucose 4-epimerase [Spirochaetia bacterium]